MELNIHNLKKVYNERVAVYIPEFQINKGEIIGIIGNNGAGKTTFFKLLLDLLKADSGYILSRGENICKTTNWKEYTSSYLGEGFLINFLTAEEYFNFIANSYKIALTDCNKTIDTFKYFMNEEIINKKKYIRDYSSGNQQKIGIIGAFISKPDILILDEPFNFLDPTSQNEIQYYIENYCKENKATVILSSHNLDCILKIATRIVLMENGLFIRETKTVNEELKNDLITYFEKQR